MESLLSEFADERLALETRTEALNRYSALPSGRERPGRYWRVDLDAITVGDLPLRSVAGEVEIVCSDERVAIGATPIGFGTTSARSSKFGALAAAFANRYAFVTVPKGVDVVDPIVITYRIGERGTLFPYTCIHAERGARATIVERIDGGKESFVCGITEVVSDEESDVAIASLQNLPGDARCFASRAALPGRDAAFSWATSDLGAALAVAQVDVDLFAPGAQTHLASIFFPRGAQHVDIRSTIDHRVGETVSTTTVKSAATGRGQARYVGNIRIAERARRSDASLRDDALLLSPTAHIDSVPALEINNNDVKAYHGATVGALDAETLFYMTTRGIDRDAAERMVTLGFFEPALERFPASVREHVRTALAEKIA
jgi:Fe-S cluster assembly protein SufD